MKISSSRQDYDSRLEMTLVIRALLCADYTPGFMQMAAFKVTAALVPSPITYAFTSTNSQAPLLLGCGDTQRSHRTKANRVKMKPRVRPLAQYFHLNSGF
jgi:hypothetical protein